MEIKNIYTPINLGDISNDFTEKLNKNFDTTKEDVQWLYDNRTEAVIKPATATVLGGIKASPKTANETIEVKIGTDNKLYVLPSGISDIPLATANVVGGIKASPKTDNEVSEIKIGPDGKLYGPAGGGGGGATIVAVSIDENDWVGNKISIPNSIHQKGATSSLIVSTHFEESNGVYKVSYDSPTVSSDGTVTITTRKPWKGLVLIAGGISGGGSGEVDLTEVWKAINQLKTDIEEISLIVQEI